MKNFVHNSLRGLPATAALLGTLLVGCKSSMQIKTLPYPVARLDTTVVDDYHGTPVADPYRWMEDDNSPEVAEWVAAENNVTRNYLDQIPFRSALQERLKALWNYPKDGIPTQVGDNYYFFFKNDGLQNQSVLWMREGLDGEARVFFDPNTLSTDGTVALGSISFSEDGKYMAYTLASSGSDWVDIRVMEIPSGKVLPDVIRWVKFSGASWGADSKGFYYSRYDEPAKGKELTAQGRNHKVYYHVLGQPQEQDRLIYADPAHPLRSFTPWESRDGRWLFIYANEGTSGIEILCRAKNENRFRILFPGFDYDYSIIDCKDDRAWVYTNQGAPNFRLATIDLKNPGAALVDLLPEQDRTLAAARMSGGYLMATYLKDAVSQVMQYTAQGELVREVELPLLGTAAGFDAKEEATSTFYSLSNFIAPPAIYEYDFASGESTLVVRPQVAYDPDLYTTEQIFFESKDGTRVPMFVSHRKDLVLDGNNPALLYGYGGFNIGVFPVFSPTNIALMEQGGIYAQVCLRGGNEYGETWHRGGMLENKQNVFDDFIAAAEWLIDNKYTSREKLAISGASNGGLLVGACMTQRPDLFAVAFPQVGVLDMLRFHYFTCGAGWIVEYGCSENPDQFPFLYAYSPLHNIHKGTCYPATMVMTADHDDRVVPAHSFKFAATLQAAQGCDRPVLVRIDSNAGHGAGKPTSKRIDDATDLLSFMFVNTDTEYQTR